MHDTDADGHGFIAPHLCPASGAGCAILSAKVNVGDADPGKACEAYEGGSQVERCQVFHAAIKPHARQPRQSPQVVHHSLQTIRHTQCTAEKHTHANTT